MKSGNVQDRVILRQPRHCKTLHCIHSFPTTHEDGYTDESGHKAVSVSQYTCKHPEIVGEHDDPAIEHCPIFLKKFRNEGFIEKCQKCESFEIDLWDNDIDFWCNDDKLFECVLNHVSKNKNK